MKALASLLTKERDFLHYFNLKHLVSYGISGLPSSEVGKGDTFQHLDNLSIWYLQAFSLNVKVISS